MIHPNIELKFINEKIGYGLFTTKLIPRGTIVWTLCDFDRNMTFSAEEVNAMNTDYKEIIEKYGYIDKVGSHVVCWDLARYTNHSCFPNTYSVDGFNDIAIRDIPKGKEMTCDYSFFNWRTGVMSCFCGEDNCRKEIRPKDYLSFQANEKKLVQEALTYFDEVEQPLYKFIKDKDSFLLLKNNPTMVEWNW